MKSSIMTTALLMTGLWHAPVAHAFCGTYVGSPGVDLFSGASRVVLGRNGDETVLTFANDYQGSLQEFALVVPVPEILDEDSVKVIEPDALDRLAELTGPRLVEYTCADFEQMEMMWSEGGRLGCGCASEESFMMADSAFDDAENSLDVTVESEFSAGEYDLTVLSSEDSADLITWLQREGYGVTEEAETLLGEYIESGVYFLAAKVRLEKVPTEPGPVGLPYLSPLQIRYTETTIGLPIRLGTLNSPGTQDLLLTTMTPVDQGSIAISNYPRVEIEDECMWDEERHGPLHEMMDEAMTEAVNEAGGAAWTQAYSWSAASCDPCPPGGALEQDTVDLFGVEGAAMDIQLTHLWVRYAADAVKTDLAMYADGEAWTQNQFRYIQYKEELESRFIICGEEGFEEDPGTCPHDSERRRESSIPMAPAGLLVLGGAAAVALRRRRRD